MTIRVLFVQSQAWYTADVAMQALLMRHLDRRQVELHCACTPRLPPVADRSHAAYPRICSIPDLHVVAVDFGPSFRGTMWRKTLRAALTPCVALGVLWLFRHARRRGIQVVHATEKPRDAFLTILLAKLTGARSVLHVHTGYGDWKSGVTKWALRHVDAIVAVSRFTARSITDAGYPRDRVFVVYNGLDLSEWDPGFGAAAARRSLCIPPDAPVVGIVASLYKWKGQGDLLEAVATVRRQIPEVRLVVVGDDNRSVHPGGGSYRSELLARAAQLGLAGNVVFTGFRADIPRLMAAFDLFALPSYGDAFPTAILEAMAMQKPVVGWAAGGAPEAVVHGETGLIADFPSVPSLANALLRLLRDPELRRRFGEKGRRRVEEVFSPKRMSAAMIDVYRATLSPSESVHRTGHAFEQSGAGSVERGALE